MDDICSVVFGRMLAIAIDRCRRQIKILWLTANVAGLYSLSSEGFIFYGLNSLQSVFGIEWNRSTWQLHQSWVGSCLHPVRFIPICVVVFTARCAIEDNRLFETRVNLCGARSLEILNCHVSPAVLCSWNVCRHVENAAKARLWVAVMWPTFHNNGSDSSLN